MENILYIAQNIVHSSKHIVHSSKTYCTQLKNILYTAQDILYTTQNILYTTQNIVHSSKHIVHSSKHIAHSSKFCPLLCVTSQITDMWMKQLFMFDTFSVANFVHYNDNKQYCSLKMLGNSIGQLSFATCIF